MDVVVVGLVGEEGGAGEYHGTADVVGADGSDAFMYVEIRLREVCGETTAWPSISQVSKARPRGWSLGRSVPNTLSGWPERITLMPIRYVLASSSIAVSTLSWTWPERMSAIDAGGN